MADSEKIEFLVQDLPDAAGAKRFFAQLTEKFPAEVNKLLRPASQGLLSDVLTIAAWSPFLATTILQHREYLVWLGKKRGDHQIRTREDLLESLARFALTNSQLDSHVLLSRFRRRELLRIYLRDLRNLATISEITEELSNLADAVLAFGLDAARQELENRYGSPLETDERGRKRTAQFCVVALGKLGSKELNYASDIDLLFLYAGDGMTSGTGTRGVTTNKEFFVKLAEQTSKIVGQATGEGAAYRVDLRLRPHGRVGALAISCSEAINYYQSTARDWERQVMLRARPAAGDGRVFKAFFGAIQKFVYRLDVSVADALESVRLSKQKINQEHNQENGFDVKLGTGGIREIEFIAQALQLAYGGRDEWLRTSHTLLSLDRLADREHLSGGELTALAAAYAFLRSLEHRLQMTNGLQTHAVPAGDDRRTFVAKQMNCANLEDFDFTLRFHTRKVSAVFERVFAGRQAIARSVQKRDAPETAHKLVAQNSMLNLDCQTTISLAEASVTPFDWDARKRISAKRFCHIAPRLAEMLAINPKLIDALPTGDDEPVNEDYAQILIKAVAEASNFHDELAVLRVVWSKFYLEIAAFDAFEKIEMRAANRWQTALAEASLAAALVIVQKELGRKFKRPSITNCQLPMAILGLGRLGGRGMDYGSDLDLVLIYDDESDSPINNLTNAEFYARAAEILTTCLSSLTRDGFLYRVDLRLRPDGKNGATTNGSHGFLRYLETRAAIWEWLAYVKLRAVGGKLEFARQIELSAREIIHAKARVAPVEQLKNETRRVRDLLEQQKSPRARRGEIDIKHGAGGLLDVYFIVRFLQLRDALFDEDANRTTSFTLQKLHEAGSLEMEHFEILKEGYDFLRRLDHALRLVIGRSAKLPSAGNPLLQKIAERLKFYSTVELLADLAVHNANIRTVYELLLA